MAANSRAEDLARQARFVFQGRVKRLGASTMKEAVQAGRTAIVTVDEVLQAPEALRHYAGKDVTVQLRAGQKLAAGQAAVFFTNPWLFGKSVAVQALAVQPAVKKARDAVRVGVERDPVRTLDERDARAHVESADVVVSGRVKSVRVPDVPAPKAVRGARAAAAPGATLQRPSEHDPMWREAVVEVEDVHKGSHKRKTIIVRFPASRDIMWSEAPKLRPGQEGYFVLHKPSEGETPPLAAGTKGARAAKARKPKAAKAAAGAQVYTILHAGDFESFTRPQALHALIRASGPPDIH